MDNDITPNEKLMYNVGWWTGCLVGLTTGIGFTLVVQFLWKL